MLFEGDYEPSLRKKNRQCSKVEWKPVEITFKTVNQK